MNTSTTTKTKFSRHIVPDTKAGHRGHFAHHGMYRGWLIVLNDDGYNHPAWCITIIKTMGIGPERHSTLHDYSLQTAKFEAMRLVDRYVDHK